MVFHFEHCHLQRQMDLWRRKPHAAVFPHGLDHIVEQRLKFRRGDFGRVYRMGARADYGMTEPCDLQDHESYRRSFGLVPRISGPLRFQREAAPTQTAQG